MKKIIALLLVLTMAVSLVACGNNAKAPETTTGSVVDYGETAEDLLNNIWDSMDEGKLFPVGGGDAENTVMDAAGKYSLEDEGLTATLLVPADQIENISEAASLMHGMMQNNFTCGAFKVTGDVTAFVDAMYTAISGNRWMCGMPEKMAIAVVGEFVVAFWGINDCFEPFMNALQSAYPNAELDYNEAITG